MYVYTYIYIYIYIYIIYVAKDSAVIKCRHSFSNSYTHFCPIIHRSFMAQLPTLSFRKSSQLNILYKAYPIIVN